MFIVIVPGTSVLNSTTNEAGALTAVVRPSRKVAASKVKGSIWECLEVVLYCNVVVIYEKLGDTGPINSSRSTGIIL